MTRSALELSFMKNTMLVAGNAMPMTMRMGMTVQRTSKKVFDVKAAGACPTDRRCRQIDQAMRPNTIAMIATMTTSNTRLRSEMRWAISVWEGWYQKRLMAAALAGGRAD